MVGGSKKSAEYLNRTHSSYTYLGTTLAKNSSSSSNSRKVETRGLIKNHTLQILNKTDSDNDVCIYKAKLVVYPNPPTTVIKAGVSLFHPASVIKLLLPFAQKHWLFNDFLSALFYRW